MGSVQDWVRDVVDRSVAAGDATVVVEADSGIVQWLTTAGAVFRIEAIDRSATPQQTVSLWHRLRRKPERRDPPNDTERRRAALEMLGFHAGEPGYLLLADDGELSSDRVAHVVAAVLHDVFEVRDTEQLSLEIF